MTSPNNIRSDVQQSPNRPSGDAGSRHTDINLSYRYGSIGIEAVAAAVRYAGASKNPAYAPVATRIESRRHESAV
jgi:hypothetical protein